jgi:hypothetical protein
VAGTYQADGKIPGRRVSRVKGIVDGSGSPVLREGAGRVTCGGYDYILGEIKIAGRICGRNRCAGSRGSGRAVIDAAGRNQHEEKDEDYRRGPERSLPESGGVG